MPAHSYCLKTSRRHFLGIATRYRSKSLSSMRFSAFLHIRVSSPCTCLSVLCVQGAKCCKVCGVQVVGVDTVGYVEAAACRLVLKGQGEGMLLAMSCMPSSIWIRWRTRKRSRSPSRRMLKRRVVALQDRLKIWILDLPKCVIGHHFKCIGVGMVMMDGFCLPASERFAFVVMRRCWNEAWRAFHCTTCSHHPLDSSVELNAQKYAEQSYLNSLEPALL